MNCNAWLPFSARYIYSRSARKISKDDREKRIREQFYGNRAKNIKGACEQIIDGDQAFKSLYETIEGEDGSERRLKSFCSGGHATSYIPGIDFTVESIAYYSNGKSYAGKSIWDMGIEVHKSLKKALLLMPRVSHIVNVDKSGMVTNFASGKNEKNFFEAISDGMYSLDLKEKKKEELQESDQEDNVGESLQIQHAGDIAFDTDNSSSGLEGEISSSRPFGVKAPPRYVFYGLFSFVCCIRHSTIITRNAQRKNECQRRDAEREVGHN